MPSALTWFNTSLGDVSFTTLDSQGWLRQGDEMVLDETPNNALSWTGVTGEQIQMVFSATVPDGKVVVTWDGHEDTLDLVERKDHLRPCVRGSVLCVTGLHSWPGTTQFPAPCNGSAPGPAARNDLHGKPPWSSLSGEAAAPGPPGSGGNCGGAGSGAAAPCVQSGGDVSGGR